jgi:hypothetical protein
MNEGAVAMDGTVAIDGGNHLCNRWLCVPFQLTFDVPVLAG